MAKLYKLPSRTGGAGGGLLLAVLLLSACSTTKYIPDDDQLFIGLKKIVYTDYEPSEHATTVQEELEAALATAPNGALFGSSYYRTPFPYGLWVWNATTNSHGVLKQWLNRTLGKPPVLMSQVNPALRAQVARQVLRSNGYMHGDVTYEEVTQKNPKKAKIAYTVHMDTLMRVDSLSYVGFPSAMQHLIDSTRHEALIDSGKPFSVANLDAERTRVSQLLRNNGYYFYQSNYASYLADTFGVQNRARLRLQLADSLPPDALRPWRIGTMSMRMRRSAREVTDTTVERRYLKIMFQGKNAPIRPAVVLRNLKLRPRQLFSYADYMESMQKVNGMGVFSSVDFQFTKRDSLVLPEGTSLLPRRTRNTQNNSVSSVSSVDNRPQNNDSVSSMDNVVEGGYLDLLLDCIFDKPYDFYFETNFVNRTIGRLGPEMKVGFVRRNAFRGGEKLDVNLHGAYEWETSSKGSDMNSYQYGADVSVEFPRILFPRFRSQRPEQRLRRIRRRYYATPTTIAKVSSDVVYRPNYYKMHIVSGEWTYRWQPSPQSRHEFSPLTVKYQFMNSHTERFDSLMITNPYLSATMEDYFIPKMRYTYTYTSPSTLHNPIRWETIVEESGNLTALYDVLVQGNGWNQKEKTLFKNPYSQFLKIETDITKTWTLSTHSKLVGHLNYGLMWSYGNSTGAPFSEMFYVGGANSIRAFPVRSIGPGAFPGMEGGRQFSYLLQNGDVKLVMNLELRHRLVGSLYGAVFLDAGNVWNSEDWTISTDDFDSYDDDPTIDHVVEKWNSMFANNRFRFRNFLDQIATGTGVGLRYDLDFLVLRLDWGFGLHLPYDTGHGGYLNIPRFKDMHTLHFAIGYPF